MQRQAAIWILLATGAALLVIALGRPALVAGGQGVSVLYFTLLLAWMGSAVWARYRIMPGTALRDVVIWLAIFVAVAAGYRLWQAWGGHPF